MNNQAELSKYDSSRWVDLTPMERSKLTCASTISEIARSLITDVCALPSILDRDCVQYRILDMCSQKIRADLETIIAKMEGGCNAQSLEKEER